MAAQWPRVAAWLATAAPGLSGWGSVSVFDGPPRTDAAPAAYLTVGYVENDSAGSYQQVQDDDGFQIVETGSVRSQLVVQTGDPDPAATLRATLFGLADALEANIRADRTLGGTLTAESQVDFAATVVTVRNENGAAMSLVLTLSYLTVT